MGHHYDAVCIKLIGKVSFGNEQARNLLIGKDNLVFVTD